MALDKKTMALVVKATELLEQAIEPHNPSFDKGALVETLTNAVTDSIENKIEASASSQVNVTAHCLSVAYAFYKTGNVSDAMRMVLTAMKDESAPEFFDAVDSVNDDSGLDPESEDIVNEVEKENEAEETILASILGEDEIEEEDDYTSTADEMYSDNYDEDEDENNSDADQSEEQVLSTAKTTKTHLSKLARGNLEDL